jgi:hypothetical protein
MSEQQTVIDNLANRIAKLEKSIEEKIEHISNSESNLVKLKDSREAYIDPNWIRRYKF